MSGLLVFVALPVLCFCANAQAPSAAEAPAPEPPKTAVLENTGKPMRVPFQCTVEDMRLHGLSCPPEEPCPAYLELTASEAVGNKIFVSGNIHTQANTLSSILLASADSGKIWYEPHERIRSATLDQIQFFDFEAGWVSGQYVHASPRDPFFLLTTDGGKTWRARPVYSDGRLAGIERFRFDSRTHGTVWLDSESGEAGRRYEVYETMTGGDSWMVREVSDRPSPGAAAGAKPPASDWRIRADAATKAYRIEKREGNQWHTLASFLVHIGECREPEVLLAEPPPPVVEQPAAPAAPETPEPKRPARPPSLKKPQQ